MYSVSCLMGILDKDEDQVLYLIEDGQVRWAFDIASPKARARELRVWRGSLGRECTDDVAAVLADILPKPVGTMVTVVGLARCFCCSRSHVLSLIRAGELTEVDGIGRGVTSTRRVDRASVEAFLMRSVL